MSAAASVLATMVLIVGVPLNLYVTRKLLGLLKESGPIKPPLLRERVIVAVCVLVNVTVFALTFWNNDTFPPVFGLDVTKIVTRGSEAVIAFVPASYWLILYRRPVVQPTVDDLLSTVDQLEGPTLREFLSRLRERHDFETAL